MATIHEIATRLNDYVKNINDNMERIAMSVEEQIVDYNRKQMLGSRGSDDGALIHTRTNSPNLSKAYAKRTGKSKPNIFESGSFQKAMYMEINNSKDKYNILSKHELIIYLPDNYTNLFGIAPSNQPSVKSITTKAMANDMRINVFK